MDDGVPSTLARTRGQVRPMSMARSEKITVHEATPRLVNLDDESPSVTLS